MSAGRLRLVEADRARLISGAAVLGIELEETALNKLCTYAELLGIWTERMNLVSCASAGELVDRHFLDSLAVEPLLPDGGALADLGSGAGFPGVPLAIVAPARRVLLVEARRRRANFLREVWRTLGLENVEVLEQRAEVAPEEPIDRVPVVVSRAVWAEPAELFGVAAGWLSEGGVLLWMRTENLPIEFPDTGSAMVWQRRAGYQIGNDRPRSVEVFAKVA